MKIQISTDYAIRILRYLHENEDGLHTAMSIAQAIGITYPFFIKIANQMKKEKLLHSVQGRNGGYQLGKPALEISLYDVFLCMEGDLQINRCFKENEDEPCTNGRKEHCNLHKVLQDLQDEIIASMSGMSVAALVHSAKDDMRKERQRNRAATDKEIQKLQGHWSESA